MPSRTPAFSWEPHHTHTTTHTHKYNSIYTHIHTCSIARKPLCVFSQLNPKAVTPTGTSVSLQAYESSNAWEFATAHIRLHLTHVIAVRKGKFTHFTLEIKWKMSTRSGCNHMHTSSQNTPKICVLHVQLVTSGLIRGRGVWPAMWGGRRTGGGLTPSTWKEPNKVECGRVGQVTACSLLCCCLPESTALTQHTNLLTKASLQV